MIDAATLVTHVHRSPGPAGYADVTEHPADATLVPALAPALSLCLAALDPAE